MSNDEVEGSIPFLFTTIQKCNYSRLVFLPVSPSVGEGSCLVATEAAAPDSTVSAGFPLSSHRLLNSPAILTLLDPICIQGYVEGKLKVKGQRPG
jgi:hypothetical protein